MSKRKAAPGGEASPKKARADDGKEEGKVKVGLLGATGTVGQRFIELLQGHPWFELHALGASESSAGKTYKEATKWKLSFAMPESVKGLEVRACEPDQFKDCRVIFSALDQVVAGPIEEAFAKAGHAVFSNAKNHRYDPDVPILIPHVNASHIEIIKHQEKTRGWPKGGYIVTNANCSSTGLVIPLRPLLDKFGVEQVFVVTLQAISGAGYPGVASMDILDNVIPLIGGEEPKLEMEPQKILGGCSATAFSPCDFKVSAHANRVAVMDGHTACVSVKLKKKATPEECVKVMREYLSEAQTLKLPSAPPAPIIVLDDDDRPQPRLDRNSGNGMVCTVGRVRKCNLFDVKFVLLSHNTVIGAAGGSIQNAELAYVKKLI